MFEIKLNPLLVRKDYLLLFYSVTLILTRAINSHLVNSSYFPITSETTDITVRVISRFVFTLLG